MREDDDFADVTLACEDGKQFKAHKVILATSSPSLQNILRKNSHAHPLMYMRGMKSEDLVAIMDFLYCGEAKIYQENLSHDRALERRHSLLLCTYPPNRAPARFILEIGRGYRQATNRGKRKYTQK